MIILTIILAIISISAAVGVIAALADLLGKKSGNHKPYGPYEWFVKRGLDAFFAIGAIIVLTPVMLFIAILVRIKLGSPVIFIQNRPGRNEKIFKLYKFRSMTDNRDENGELLPDDVRLTKVGRILRSTSIDELPELINILKGDMSIIGPRPLLVRYLDRYNEEQHHRHDVRPGLTGYAQAHGRNAVSWEDKFAMDIWYTKHITFIGDVRIIWDTIISVVKREGISSGTSVTMEEFMGTPEGVNSTWRP